MSVHVLIIGHGTLPRDMACAAEMIYGPVEGVEVLCLPADQDLDAYRGAMTAQMEEYGEEGLLILADLKGGTPFLTASRAMRDYWDRPIELVTGLNLPMLTEVFNSMDEGLTARELADIAAGTGREGITDFRQAMEAKRKGETT